MIRFKLHTIIILGLHCATLKSFNPTNPNSDKMIRL
jgi:hypothetical protein